jgi:cytochrome P450
MPGAVEEFLRYDTSAERSTSRYAAEDIALGGVPIPRGSMVVVASARPGATPRRPRTPTPP